MPMNVFHSKSEIRNELRMRKRQAAISVGFVPTMGYLHAGHVSLLQEARRGNDLVVLSIFVNPLQFGPNEDLDKYPRDLERDLHIAEEAGVDIVFVPAVEDMYPSPTLTKVVVHNVTERLCGASRPGHFDGVATVVTKLFNIVQPDQAYFGMKDAQQVAVIQQMVLDLDIPVEIVACSTLREPDGLAMSSRNVYLNPQERKEAVVLNQALSEAEQDVQSGALKLNDLKDAVTRRIRQSPLAQIDYVEVLQYPSLNPILERKEEEHTEDHTLEGRIIIAVAVRFGATRLIDNRVFAL